MMSVVISSDLLFPVKLNLKRIKFELFLAFHCNMVTKSEDIPIIEI
jgi:hypothetical protein